MRIFKNTWFTKFAGKQGITDRQLREMVCQLESGNTHADLGGGVYKLQVARAAEGKSSGYRVIVFFQSGKCTFYVYGFAKSTMANINTRELKAYKEAAREYLSMTDAQIEDRIKHGQLIEL